MQHVCIILYDFRRCCALRQKEKEADRVQSEYTFVDETKEITNSYYKRFQKVVFLGFITAETDSQHHKTMRFCYITSQEFIGILFFVLALSSSSQSIFKFLISCWRCRQIVDFVVVVCCRHQIVD